MEIGCPKDFNVAAGFAKYSVDVQRGSSEPSDLGGLCFYSTLGLLL